MVQQARGDATDIRMDYAREGSGALLSAAVRDLLIPSNIKGILRFTDEHFDPQEFDEAEREVYVCGHLEQDGTVCQFTGTKHALANHKRCKHGQVDYLRACVVSNQCPICYELFSTRHKAQRHIKRSMELKRCPGRVVRHKNHQTLPI